MYLVFGHQLLLFPIDEQISENVCSGEEALLTVSLCVDCYRSPTEWLNRKSYVEWNMRARGLHDVQIEMNYIHAGQCPICEIKRSKNDMLDSSLSYMTEFKVDFDELVEIRARRIVN